MPTPITYPGVYIEEAPSGSFTISGVATSITAFIGMAADASAPANEPISINNFGEYERTFGGLSQNSAMGFAVRDYFLNGGGRAIIVHVPDSGSGYPDDAGIQGLKSDKTGLFALEKTDLFNILCIPPYAGPGSDLPSTLLSEAAAYCEDRRAFLIVDPPSDWDSKADAIAGIGSIVASKNAAVYFPRLMQNNPFTNQVEEFPPCGAVAGVMARTDSERGIWKAPAGIDAVLNNVPALSVPLTDEENGELNPLGINCLRARPPAGRIIWGARTRFGDDARASEWKYVPVRRLALYLEESLFRGTQWAVFEPNDEPLWAQIRLNINSFMQILFRQGAFAGSTPREAYFIKCDAETTTQDDVDRGIVNIQVGFAPLKPAEFVIITIQQMTGQ